MLLALFRLSPRSRLAKQFRQLELERLFIEFIVEHERYPGSVELAEALNVTPRTVRNYLRERRERLHGPAKVWVHWHGYDGKPARPPELLTIGEYAERTGFSVREVRRLIWEQRRDWIAEVREQYRKPQETALG
jgi:predicted transcriptional regulator